MKKQILAALCALSLIVLPCTTNCIDQKYYNDGKLAACIAVPAAVTYIASIKKNNALRCILICAITHTIIRNFVAKNIKGEEKLPDVHMPLVPFKIASDLVARGQKAIADSKVTTDAKNILALYSFLA